MTSSKLRICVTLLLVCTAVSVIVWFPRGDNTAELLAQAAKDLRSNRYAAAEATAVRAINAGGCLRQGYLIAGEAAARQGRFSESAEYYRRGADCETDPREKSRGYFFGAESFVQIGRLTDAEGLYRKALQADPEYELAEERLEFLFRTEGRTSESIRILERRVAAGAATVEQLLNYGHPDRPRILPDQFLRFLPQLEQDGLPLLALAKESLFEHDHERARQQLQTVLKHSPRNCDAQSAFGRLVLDDEPDKFPQWFLKLPAECRRAARIAVVRGLWAERNSLWPEAAGGLLQCLKIEPRNREALFHFSIALGHLDQPEGAEYCRELARTTELIERTLDDIHDEKDIFRNVLKLIELLTSVGRHDEAANWLRLTEQRFGSVAELQIAHTQLQSAQAASERWQEFLSRMTAMDFPSPDPRQLNLPQVTSAGELSALDFTITASESGLAFHYVNADDGATVRGGRPRRMVQSNGGGIGVIDIDADGWPDLYWTQGGSWPSIESSYEPDDRIFRNQRGTAFQDITAHTGAMDRDFGQGVAVGDLDNDGFDEIYVANVGGNRLFRNNGDGTLSDISVTGIGAGNEWSTSCAIADFDLNGHPDLYVVNYLSLDDASAEICHEGTKLRSCRPEGFVAADDRLFLNTGEWPLTDVSAECGIVRPHGRGLGLIAADFNGDSRLDVFVGNDAVPNFLFLNQQESFFPAPDTNEHQHGNSSGGQLRDRGALRFEESAVHRGIATDAEGRSQACMGIACADFDLDQRSDIFVTNFYNESNTLYLGQPGGMFVDRTPSWQLSRPSLTMLGFGTQPLDADLDGDQDLVVLNGHLDDLTASGVPYSMKPQFFENQAGRLFVEGTLDCRFFGEPQIGRALAKLDWNRDGREDLAVGLLNAPSFVLTNTTPPKQGWIGIQLIGTRSSRSAIGSRVTLQAGEWSESQQLTAGSGFQAANQNRLVFAVKQISNEKPIRLSIIWPDGKESHMTISEPNRDYLCVESATKAATTSRAIQWSD